MQQKTFPLTVLHVFGFLFPLHINIQHIKWKSQSVKTLMEIKAAFFCLNSVLATVDYNQNPFRIRSCGVVVVNVLANRCHLLEKSSKRGTRL